MDIESSRGSRSSCCGPGGEEAESYSSSGDHSGSDQQRKKKKSSVLLIIVDKASGIDNRVFLGMLLGVFVIFSLTIVISLFMLSIYIWLK